MVAMSLLKVSPEKYIEFVLETKVNVNGGVPSQMTLKNVSETTVVFKIKTTAPKYFFVRPSSGCLKPEESINIKVILYIHGEAGAENDGHMPQSDRFLIQAVEVDSETTNVSKEFWQNLEKSKIHDLKLHVLLKKNDSVVEQQFATSGSGMPSFVNPSELSNMSTNGCPIPLSTARKSSSPVDLIQSNAAAAASSDADPKFNELMQYCLALEKEKASLTKDNDSLKQRCTLDQKASFVCQKCGADNNNAAAAANAVNFQQPSSAASPKDLWHIIALILAVVAGLRAFNYLWHLLFKN